MWCQLIIGFERNKQAEGDAKNYSAIRLLKDRKYGKSGLVYTKYLAETGRLIEREKHEVDEKNPFALSNGVDETSIPGGNDDSKPF